MGHGSRHAQVAHLVHYVHYPVVYGPFRGFSIKITMGNGWKWPLVVDLSNENDGVPLPCWITRGHLFLVDLLDV